MSISLPVGLTLFLYRIYNIYRLVVNRFEIEKEIKKQIQVFSPNSNGGGNCSLIRDIKKSYVLYLAKPQEYFLFNFIDKTTAERSEYLTDYIKDTYLKKYARIEKARQLQDKFYVYEKMRQYYNREACLVSNENDRAAFNSFISGKTRFIAKPNAGSFGANTNIYDLSSSDPVSIFNELLSYKNSWILEELIEQVPEISQFNSTSVNSVRIPTFRTKKGYEIFGTFMRVGRKGSVVDNAGAGGIFVRVDEISGEIISDGFTEQGDIFENHPDSNIPFKGFKIPCYENLKSIAIKCHKELPDHKYVGWDFALTKDGWVLLEGNWGQYLCQQVSGLKPMKKQFINLIKS